MARVIHSLSSATGALGVSHIFGLTHWLVITAENIASVRDVAYALHISTGFAESGTAGALCVTTFGVILTATHIYDDRKRKALAKAQG